MVNGGKHYLRSAGPLEDLLRGRRDRFAEGPFASLSEGPLEDSLREKR